MRLFFGPASDYGRLFLHPACFVLFTERRFTGPFCPSHLFFTSLSFKIMRCFPSLHDPFWYPSFTENWPVFKTGPISQALALLLGFLTQFFFPDTLPSFESCGMPKFEVFFSPFGFLPPALPNLFFFRIFLDYGSSLIKTFRSARAFSLLFFFRFFPFFNQLTPFLMLHV